MNAISRVYMRVLLWGLLYFTTVPLMSNEINGYIPVGGYEYIAIDSKALQSPGFGTIITGENSVFSGIYKYNSFSDKDRQSYQSVFHSIDIMYQAHRGKHWILSNFTSESNKPVSGDLATFQAAAIYMYQLLKNEGLTLLLGLGAAVGDFGIYREDGTPWPILPVPFIGINYHSTIIEGDFSFVSGPSLSVTVLPERKFRLSGIIGIDEFRDFRDLIFDASLHYRFFAGVDSKKDFAGISVGIRNNHLSFTLGDSQESYEIQYYSVFTELDLSFLKISGGYAFGGREIIGQNTPVESGEGYFLSLQAMYQFEGLKYED